MKLILIGASGAGKGTQAKKISSKYSIPHISTGDILREHIKNKTEIGIKVKNLLDQGILVSDDIITELVKLRINEADCKNGFILDGFPRTISQAQDLESIVNIDKAVYINVDDNLIIDRLTGRRICKNCTAMYHVQYAKPKITNVCDVCGNELSQREDDKPETVKDRLKIFHELTSPIINFYKDKGCLFEVNGAGDIMDISETIINGLEG